jgi:hypothetical protein
MVAQTMFTLRLRGSQNLPAPAGVSVECKRISPYDLGAADYDEACKERRLWCEDRAPGKYHVRPFRSQQGIAGMQYWIVDENTAFEFKLRFG